MSVLSEEEEDEATLLSGSQSDISDEGSGSDDELFPTPPLSQHTFAPPFYGRPPTPLPPSPSLTSLLRPSRPTTPDASDDDLEPLPRASPKVPTYEYYGFVLHLFSSLCFLIYLLWSYLPSPFLHVLGIYYYPNRWWSIAIPSFIVTTLVYIYVALAAYNTEYMTLPMSSIENIVDDAAKVAIIDADGRIVADGRTRERQSVAPLWRQDGSLNWCEVWNEGTDAVMDVPLAGVCEVLYGEWRGELGESGK